MPEIKWDTGLYNDKHGFVTRYGEDLLEWLQPGEGETILDLGCGTGQLSDEIRSSGATVTGIDNSTEMINRARANFPEISFEVMDATRLSFHETFDAVFSNATLHWINDQENLLKGVWNSLKKDGRFVFEMGGKKNIDRIYRAINKAMIQDGFGHLRVKEQWFYPSVAEYATLLEKSGFTVSEVKYFERDTPLKGEDGMKNWIEMFASFLFRHLTSEQRASVTARAIEYLHPTNYRDGTWYADYVRLRMKAIKFQ